MKSRLAIPGAAFPFCGERIVAKNDSVITGKQGPRPAREQGAVSDATLRRRALKSAAAISNSGQPMTVPAIYRLGLCYGNNPAAP